MKPKVLVSDNLSPSALKVFQDKGIQVDFEPELGKDKKQLAEGLGIMMDWQFAQQQK